MTFRTYLKEKAQIKEKYSDNFLKEFHVSLESYWDKRSGFDMDKFDKEIVKSGNDSVKLKIEKMFGINAVNLITDIYNEELKLMRELTKRL